MAHLVGGGVGLRVVEVGFERRPQLGRGVKELLGDDIPTVHR